MTELQGLIKVNGTTGLTCCETVPRIFVDGKDLHMFIKDMTSLTTPVDDDEHSTNEPTYNWKVEYCTSKTPFVEQTFNDCAAQKQIDMLYSQEVIGCYSTWTCGTGDYNFVLNQKGHSLMDELASFDGMYVWISFGEEFVGDRSEVL